MLYMMKDRIGEKLKEFVKNGGTLLATTMTGLADENDRCVFGEYPGPLKDVLGIWVEETDALFPGEKNSMLMEASAGSIKEGRYACGFLCDVIHSRGAKVLARYATDFYEGVPCFTLNRYGKGLAYYVGTEPEESFLASLAARILDEKGISPVLEADSGVEVTKRTAEGADTFFIINHNHREAWVELGGNIYRNLLAGEDLTGTVAVKARDVLLLG